jgi:hypothetical protein
MWWSGDAEILFSTDFGYRLPFAPFFCGCVRFSKAGNRTKKLLKMRCVLVLLLRTKNMRKTCGEEADFLRKREFHPCE